MAALRRASYRFSGQFRSASRRAGPGPQAPACLAAVVWPVLSTRQVGEELFQGVEIGRLGEVAVEAGFAGAGLAFFLAPAGLGDDEHLLAAVQLADAPAGIVAVHPRHAEVE